MNTNHIAVESSVELAAAAASATSESSSSCVEPVGPVAAPVTAPVASEVPAVGPVGASVGVTIGSSSGVGSAEGCAVGSGSGVAVGDGSPSGGSSRICSRILRIARISAPCSRSGSSGLGVTVGGSVPVGPVGSSPVVPVGPVGSPPGEPVAPVGSSLAPSLGPVGGFAVGRVVGNPVALGNASRSWSRVSSVHAAVIRPMSTTAIRTRWMRCVPVRGSGAEASAAHERRPAAARSITSGRRSGASLAPSLEIPRRAGRARTTASPGPAMPDSPATSRRLAGQRSCGRSIR